MKILVTGAQGQIGRELVAIAASHGYEVFAAGRAELDITNADNVNALFKQHNPDIVINAAAYTAVDKAETEQDMAYAINRDGAKNLGLACKEHSIPLFHISTDYVFNGEKNEPYKEDDEVSPLGVYGESKWQGEQAIREHHTKSLILRVAWVFGAQGNNFVKTMLRLANERNELNVVADQFGGPSPAKEIALALIQLVDLYKQNNNFDWGTYHFCGKPKTTWHDFANEIFNQANKIGILNKKITVNAITTEQYPTPAKRPQNSMLDCAKIKETFDIDMPDWRAGLLNVLTEINN